MSEKILCVDDDANILAAYKRQLRKQFHIDTALGGQAGLETIAARGPYVVVVSDLRMPGMDGIRFLSKIKEIAPDTVRMMLTGYADVTTAVEAVNEGNIFRFLTKPCSPEILAKALESGITQYRLVTAERELLEKTLRGSVKVLTEILSLVNPTAFSRSFRIRRYVRHMAARLQVPNLWQFEIAAMLSHIGCVTLPPDTLDKVYSGRPLSDEEQKFFSDNPLVGRNLLANIPRLEEVSQMIAVQQKSFVDWPERVDAGQTHTIALGGQMLKIAIDLDQRIVRGMSFREALRVMSKRPQEYNPRLLAALDSFEMDEEEKVVRTARIRDLTTRMIVDEDVRAGNGLLVVAKGQQVTYPLMERLRSFAKGIGISEPFRVLVPRESFSQEPGGVLLAEEE